MATQKEIKAYGNEKLIAELLRNNTEQTKEVNGNGLKKKTLKEYDSLVNELCQRFHMSRETLENEIV